MTDRPRRVERQWGKRADDPQYHYVPFIGGRPNTTPLVTACGLLDRFHPRIEVRMDDLHCRPCLAVATKENVKP